MAVVQEGSVWTATADADVVMANQSNARVCGVKVVGGGSGMTVTLKSAGVTGGDAVYACTVSANAEKFEQVKFQCAGGLYVNISAGGGTVYVYSEA
jgi:hypothetical protein